MLCDVSTRTITPVFVCGSTVEGEEEILLPAFRTVLQQYPRALIILAPRRPERFNPVSELLASSGLRFYADHGYRHVGTLPNFVLAGLDEALYLKRLRANPRGRRRRAVGR